LVYEARVLHRGWWVPEAHCRRRYMNRIGIEGYGLRKGKGF